MAVREIYTSRDAITYEVKRVRQIPVPVAVTSSLHTKEESQPETGKAL